MQSFANIGRRVSALTALLALGACAEQNAPAPVAPVLPGVSAIPTQYRGAAFIMDVSSTRRTVRITAPSSSINSRLNPNVLAGDANYSLLGGDAIELLTSNFQAGALGAVAPNKILITFDMQILNKLAGLRLDTPTFPTPPSGVTGVQAFPFEISVTSSAGSVGSSGNEVVVTTPRGGVVEPSSDWGNLPLGDGNNHNFFNDVGCTATSNDCFRYEPFAAIGPQGTSAAQRVGFLIDPTVGDFRAKIIVAADLAPAVAAAPGTVDGTVTSNIGPVSGATISVTGGFSGASSATGTYSIGSVTSGPNKTVSISNLPAGCTANQASFTNLTVPAAGTLTQNFVLTCAVPTGGITGTITKQQDGSALVGVSVVVTPNAGAALAAVTTAANGGYNRAAVPTIPNNGAITLSNLPAGCVNAGPYTYTGLTTGGLVRDIVVSCPPAPVTYALTGTWTTTGTLPGARTARLTFAVNMGSAPGNPTINGTAADELAGITIGANYNGTLLTFANRSGLLDPPFDLGIAGTVGGGTANATTTIAVTSGSGGTQAGAFTLVSLNFTIPAGTPSGTSITPTITVNQALAGVGGASNVTSSFTVSVPALIVP
jgi:hypothetical protein